MNLLHHALAGKEMHKCMSPLAADWDEAKSWVENLNIDGGGWRMPHEV